MRILGIETSCDETSAAVIEGDITNPQLRSLVILSQDVHALFGGVVPEIASRAHLTGIVPTVNAALRDANVSIDDLDAIAVTHAPGLVGALLVGVSYAKALGFARDIPVVPVHHLEGHLFATLLEHRDAAPPFTALLVSGGHTMLLDVPEWGKYQLLGQTRDDAAGEAFDKVAKLLGLPYPGGRPLEELARTVDRSSYRFARPMLRSNSVPGDADYYDLSFSGLKTAVLTAVRGIEASGGDVVADDVNGLRRRSVHVAHPAWPGSNVRRCRRHGSGLHRRVNASWTGWPRWRRSALDCRCRCRIWSSCSRCCGARLC